MARVILAVANAIASNRSTQIGGLLTLIVFLSAGCSSRSTLDISGTQVSFPVPAGFVALGDHSPGFRAFSERGTVGGKLIEIYLTKKDLEDVIAGHSKSRDRILAALTPTTMGNMNFDTEALAGAKTAIRDHGHMSSATFDALRSRTSAEVAELIKNRQEQAWHPAPNRKWQGVYFETADAIGDSDILTLTKEGLIVHDAEVRVNMRVRSRWVILHCNSEMHRDTDWQIPQETCKRWSQDIVTANAPALQR